MGTLLLCQQKCISALNFAGVLNLVVLQWEGAILYCFYATDPSLLAAVS